MTQDMSWGLGRVLWGDPGSGNHPDLKGEGGGANRM